MEIKRSAKNTWQTIGQRIRMQRKRLLVDGAHSIPTQTTQLLIVVALKRQAMADRTLLTNGKNCVIDTMGVVLDVVELTYLSPLIMLSR